MCNETESKVEIKLPEEKIERIVRNLMNRERSQPNIERIVFVCPTDKVYHAESIFIPSQTMLDQSRGIFKDKDECVSDE